MRRSAPLTQRPFPPILLLLTLTLLLGGAACTGNAGAVNGPTPALERAATAVTTNVPRPTSAPAKPSEAPPQPTPIATSAAPSTATPLPLPEFVNPRQESLATEADAWGADFVWLNRDNTGVWQYAADSFIHPIALEVDAEWAYLLDAGRVLVFNLASPAPPQVLLAPGDSVEGVYVLEPLDLALGADGLLVLDRAGDVYRYDFGAGTWHLDRYDRPVEESSGHYFVALDAPDSLPDGDARQAVRVLLETNYKFVMEYGGERTPLWNLPEARAVDVSALGDSVYVLQRALHDPTGELHLYRDTRSIGAFGPLVAMERPLQLVAGETAVYVLDRGGARLLTLDPAQGALLRIYQLPQNEPISAFWIDPTGERLLLAGRNRLYFVDEPARLATVPGGPTLSSTQPHDPRFLASLTDLTVPIGGSNITFRDFQMPGAPRHYRLGTHEGLDFYWQPGTRVLATASGVVVRADTDYVPPTAAQLGAWRADLQALGYSSAEILDNFRGRQVWIEHDNGLLSRYAHLRSIAPGIVTGARVEPGQWLGEVGNSGSPASLESESADAHLHFELWLGDHYLGQFMRPIETREWVERILGR